MTHILIVTKSFLHFRRGDTISDASAVSSILTGEHRRYVIKVSSQNLAKG